MSRSFIEPPGWITARSIRDSFASEHGARMTAMHKATDNATELEASETL